MLPFPFPEYCSFQPFLCIQILRILLQIILTTCPFLPQISNRTLSYSFLAPLWRFALLIHCCAVNFENPKFTNSGLQILFKDSDPNHSLPTHHRKRRYRERRELYFEKAGRVWFCLGRQEGDYSRWISGGLLGATNPCVGERISRTVCHVDWEDGGIGPRLRKDMEGWCRHNNIWCTLFLFSLFLIKFHEQLKLYLMFAYKLNPPGQQKGVCIPSFLFTQTNFVISSVGVISVKIFVHCWFILCSSMEKGKKSFKNVICSDRNFCSEQTTQLNHSESTDPKTTMVEETKNSSEKKKKPETSSSGTKKDKGKGKMKLDMVAYLAKLSGVKENINHLKETSLFGFVIGEPIEIAKIRPKIRNDWKMKREFLVHERSNGWFEIRFANPIDRNKIWDGRPYHIFGQLLLLKPWKSNFDTATESITQVDMWIRIPQLPVEYLSFDVLNTIIEWNNMGIVIKLDQYTEKQQRLRYARLCINVDLLSIADNMLIVPDENAKEHSYNVWFEDFPKGCGNCGDASHTFNFCPLRAVRNQPITVTLSKPSSSKLPKKPLENDEANIEPKWETGGKPISIPDKGKGILSPLEPMKKGSIQVIYKTDSSSSGSKGSKLSKHSATPLVGNAGENQIKQPSLATNKEEKKTDVVVLFPNDELNQGEHMNTPLNSSLSQGYEGQENEINFFEDFLLNDEEGCGGELSQEEIEALIATELVSPAHMEDSQSMQSYHSLANASSVMIKMEKMDMKQPQASNSESSKRKGSSGMYDTATSKLKGGETKKMKKNE